MGLFFKADPPYYTEVGPGAVTCACTIFQSPVVSDFEKTTVYVSTYAPSWDCTEKTASAMSPNADTFSEEMASRLRIGFADDSSCCREAISPTAPPEDTQLKDSSTNDYINSKHLEKFIK